MMSLTNRQKQFIETMSKPNHSEDTLAQKVRLNIHLNELTFLIITFSMTVVVREVTPSQNRPFTHPTSSTVADFVVKAYVPPLAPCVAFPQLFAAAWGLVLGCWLR